MAARGSMIEPGTFRRFGERVFFAKRRDADRGFRGVIVSDRTDPERSFVIFAEEGRLDLDERDGELTLHLERGDVHVESPLGDERPAHRISFATFDVAFDAGDLFSAELTRLRPREMTQAQLRAALASGDAAPGEAPPLDATAIALQLERRAALPFAPVLFALIGVPLGLRPVGGGRAFGAIVCALLAFAYYALLTFGGYLALEGLVAPAPALWLPNAAFAVAATALLLRGRGIVA
jgi:lipopolysaccharide export system permease protein